MMLTAQRRNSISQALILSLSVLLLVGCGGAGSRLDFLTVDQAKSGMTKILDTSEPVAITFDRVSWGRAERMEPMEPHADLRTQLKDVLIENGVTVVEEEEASQLVRLDATVWRPYRFWESFASGMNTTFVSNWLTLGFAKVKLTLRYEMDAVAILEVDGDDVGTAHAKGHARYRWYTRPSSFDKQAEAEGIRVSREVGNRAVAESIVDQLLGR